MTVEVDPRTRHLPELDVEQEVDFGRYARLVGARWWLLIVGAIVGAVIGLAASVTASRPYEATTIVYLGQPYFPGSEGNPIQNLSTKLAFVQELVVSRATLAIVSASTGIRPGVLQSHVTVEPVTGLTKGKVQLPSPLIAVTVDRLSAKRSAAAANAFGDVLQRYFSSYVDQKLETYKKRFARTQTELAQVNATIDAALKQQKALQANHSLPPTEKLLLLANINNVLQYNTTRQNNLESAELTHDDTVALAEQIEKARVLEPARVHRQAAPSRRTSVLVGGFVGLLVGLIATLLWEPVARRFRSRTAAA